MFKILNGYENIDSNIFFQIKEGKITRGHNYTLVKKQSRLDVRKYSFSQRTITFYANFTHGPNTSASAQYDNTRGAWLTQEGCTIMERKEGCME